ncbi:MAG: ThuA domain-containing protein [Verrucomicrobiota bacterium]
MKPKILLALLAALAIPLTLIATAQDKPAAKNPEKSKVVFISGKPSHGPMAHEHRAGNIILAEALNSSGLPVEAVVLPEDGYPADPSVLDDAATIVVFCTGHENHLLNPNLKEFDALMKKGTGVVMIHWATEAKVGTPAKRFLEWMGGFCDLNWSVNPHWKPNFDTFPDHPVANGLEPFAVDDEWYYHMRFVPELKGVTPILSDLPGPETLKRPDGARSGNPHVRKAVANGEEQHVAWAYDRPDGKGRGFGFTGAHNHESWQNDNFRKVVLNAIAWTAGLEVPKNGVPSKTPTDEQINANLDDKPAKKKAPAPKKPAAATTTPPKTPAPLPPERQAANEKFQKLREAQVKQLDSTKALDLLAQSLEKNENPAVRAALLRGMLQGLEGRRNLTPPPSWKSASLALDKSSTPEIKRLTQRLNQIFGDKAATEKALATLKNNKAPAPQRREALQALVTQQYPELAPVIKPLLNDPKLQIDAIRAYSAVEDPNAPTLLLNRYPKLSLDAKRATIETLAARESYANKLLAALKNKDIPRADVPVYIARSLTDLLGNKFTNVYGDLNALSKDKSQLITKYKNLLSADKLEAADPTKGRLLFQGACSACHILYGEGGKIGPDLTGSNRADIDYILLNMIDPSADIPDAYKLITVTTKDGQILAGTLAEEDDQRLILNTVAQRAVILKTDIAKRDTAPVSMMPEGLLPALQDAQVLDLVKYLQSTKQIPLPN